MFLTAASYFYGAKSELEIGQQQADAIKAQGEFQAKEYAFNAEMAEIQASEATRIGQKEASDLLVDVGVLKGAQTAALAAQGIEISSGSAAEIQKQTSESALKDAMTIRNNAWRESFGYRVQASGYRSKSRYAKLASENEAKRILLGSYSRAFTSGLTGASYLSQLGKG